MQDFKLTNDPEEFLFCFFCPKFSFVLLCYTSAEVTPFSKIRQPPNPWQHLPFLKPSQFLFWKVTCDSPTHRFSSSISRYPSVHWHLNPASVSMHIPSVHGLGVWLHSLILSVLPPVKARLGGSGNELGSPEWTEEYLLQLCYCSFMLSFLKFILMCDQTQWAWGHVWGFPFASHCILMFVQFRILRCTWPHAKGVVFGTKSHQIQVKTIWWIFDTEMKKDIALRIKQIRLKYIFKQMLDLHWG